MGFALLPLLPGETLPVCRALAPKGGAQCCLAVLWAKICFSFPLFGSRTSAAACAIGAVSKELSNIPLLLTGHSGLLPKVFLFFFIAIYMQEGCQSVNESILQCSVTNEVTIEDN